MGYGMNETPFSPSMLYRKRLIPFRADNYLAGHTDLSNNFSLIATLMMQSQAAHLLIMNKTSGLVKGLFSLQILIIKCSLGLLE